MSTLKNLRLARGLTLKEVAARIHTTEVSVSRYEKEDQRLTLPLMQKLAAALDCTVADIAGESPGKTGVPRAAKADQDETASTARIDELDVRASAGSGQIVDGEGKIAEWQLPRDLLHAATNSPVERIKIITVIGDSMQPTFNPTDKVMVDISDTRPSPPGIFVVWDGLGLVLKRVEFLPDSEPPTIRISSDNAKYQPYERAIEEAHIQGRVLGKWLWT
jgi:phage repressor protein C with HTH and peptisase S24 domain